MTKTKKQLVLTLAAALSGMFLLVSNVAFGQVYDPTKDTNTGTDPIPTPVPGVITNPDPIAQINAEIDAKRRQIEAIQQQAQGYQQQINSSLKEVQTYQSQVAIVDNQIALSNLDIQAKQGEVSNLELEISAIQISIDQKTTLINSRKQDLIDALKQLDDNSRVSTLALVLSNNNLSDFYGQAQAVASISTSLQENITSLDSLRSELQAKQDELSRSRDDINLEKQVLETKQQSLVEEKNFKNNLVTNAQRSYNQYQQLYQGSLDSEEAANSSISALQNDLERTLAGKVDELPSPAGFIWPVRGQITAYFMDADYYKYFHRQHYGIDIDVNQGTPVKAPADGIVGKIIEPQVGNLSILQIQHGGGFVTYYLHLSKIFVLPEQKIKQGDVIGLSGGLPGTAGAGPTPWYSTGDHLHFEVWKQDVTSNLYRPVDPLKYLP